MKYRHRIHWFFFMIIMAPICFSAHGDDFPSQVRQPVNASITIRQETQAANDAWLRERADLMAEYEALEADIQQLSAEITTLEQDISKETEHMDTLRAQQEAMSRISGELAPYLASVFHQLKAAVNQDLPFLLLERSQRLERLEEILDDPAAPLNEKFRKTVEALLIEAEYGRIIEVYTEKIHVDDEAITARIFRLGRLSLFCQSPDRKITGVFDPLSRKWRSLPARYGPEIHMAMEISAKRRAAAMLDLPIGRLEVP